MSLRSTLAALVLAVGCASTPDDKRVYLSDQHNPPGLISSVDSVQADYPPRAFYETQESMQRLGDLYLAARILEHTYQRLQVQKSPFADLCENIRHERTFMSWTTKPDQEGEQRINQFPLRHYLSIDDQVEQIANRNPHSQVKAEIKFLKAAFEYVNSRSDANLSSKWVYDHFRNLNDHFVAHGYLQEQ